MLIRKLAFVKLVLLLQFYKLSVCDFTAFVTEKFQDFPAYARANCPDPSIPIEQKVTVEANNTVFIFETEFSNLTYSGFSNVRNLDYASEGFPGDGYLSVAFEIPPGFQQQGWHVTNWSVGCLPVKSSGRWNTQMTPEAIGFLIQVNFECSSSGYLRVTKVTTGFRIYENYVYLDNMSNHEALTDLQDYAELPILRLVREYGEIIRNPISQCLSDFWNGVFEQTPFLDMVKYGNKTFTLNKPGGGKYGLLNQIE